MEVVLALGIASFALLTLLALLPTGIKSNQVSLEETQADGLLTVLEADLRNTHPSLASGNSLLFGLPLPYALDGNGRRVVNATLAANALHSAAVSDAQTATTNAAPPPPYQVSVVYTALPAAGSLAPVEARLVVSWRYRAGASASDLADPAKVGGFVETYAAFPAP